MRHVFYVNFFFISLLHFIYYMSYICRRELVKIFESIDMFDVAAFSLFSFVSFFYLLLMEEDSLYTLLPYFPLSLGIDADMFTCLYQYPMN